MYHILITTYIFTLRGVSISTVSIGWPTQAEAERAIEAINADQCEEYQQRAIPLWRG